MSAIREVKFLRELKHQNVIEVCYSITRAAPHITYCILKLLDVFSSKTNLNLVLEFLDSDLEMIIKDRALVFLPADIKSWMAMTFRGLEFCHRNHVLHRVPLSLYYDPATCVNIRSILGSQAQQFTHRLKWRTQNC